MTSDNARLVIISLLIITITCLGIIAAFGLNDEDIPEALWTLVGIPIGAIAGILAPTGRDNP